MTLKEVIKQLGIKLIGWVKSNCVNNLLSDRTDLPLSAAQGKALDGKITALNNNIGYLNVLNLSHAKGGRVRLVITENNTGDSMAFGALLISYSGCALASFGAKTAGKQPDKIESLCGTLYRENYINLDDGNRTLTVVCPFGVKFELI